MNLRALRGSSRGRGRAMHFGYPLEVVGYTETHRRVLRLEAQSAGIAHFDPSEAIAEAARGRALFFPKTRATRTPRATGSSRSWSPNISSRTSSWGHHDPRRGHRAAHAERGPGPQRLVGPHPRDRFRELVAVDGGSKDGTREFLAAHGVPILDQTIPGRGVAFRVAAEACHAERLIFYSPDGNEDPDDIERLDDLLIGGARLAIASRFARGAVNEEDVSPFRPEAGPTRGSRPWRTSCSTRGPG